MTGDRRRVSECADEVDGSPDAANSAALSSFPTYFNALSTVAAGMQRRRALSTSSSAAADFYSRSARLFAPSISTAKRPWPTKMEAWLATQSARTNDTEVALPIALDQQAGAAFAPQPHSDIRGWNPMGEDFQFAQRRTSPENRRRGPPPVPPRTQNIPQFDPVLYAVSSPPPSPYSQGNGGRLPMDGQGQFAYHNQQPGMGGGQYHGHGTPMDDLQGQFAHGHQQPGMGGQYHGHAIPMAVAMEDQAQFAYHYQQPGMGGQYHGHEIPMAVAMEDQAQFAHDYQQPGMGGQYHGHAIPSQFEHGYQRVGMGGQYHHGHETAMEDQVQFAHDYQQLGMGGQYHGGHAIPSQFEHDYQRVGMGGQYHSNAIPMAMDDQDLFAYHNQQLGMGGQYHGRAIPMSPRYGNVGTSSYYDREPDSSYSYYPPGSSRPDRRGAIYPRRR